MPAPTCFGCRRTGSEAPGGKGRPNYSLRRPMSALSAGNSNSRGSMTASSTLGRWHEDQDAFHASPRYVGRYATSAKIYRNMAGGQLTLSQAHLEGGAWTNCFPYDLCQPALTSVAASLQL